MPNVPHFVLELDVVAVVVHGDCWIGRQVVDFGFLEKRAAQLTYSCYTDSMLRRRLS